MFPRTLFILLSLPVCLWVTGLLRPPTAHAQPIKAPHVEVELVSEHTSFNPSSPLVLGVRMQTDPGWHVYWKYAGDSGAAPKFSWSAQVGPASSPTPFEATIQWPIPDRIPVGPLMNYGYEGEVLFIAHADPNVFSSLIAQGSAPENSSALTIHADLEWLVCMEECIPGNAALSIALPIEQGAPRANDRWAPLFESTRARLPVTESSIPVSAFYENQEYTLRFKLPEFAREAALSFIPDIPDVIENAAPQALHFDGEETSLRLKQSVISDQASPVLSGILVSNAGWTTPGLPQALEFATRVAGVPESPSPESTVDASSVQGAASPAIDTELTFGWALLFAFLGGLVLNIMPCVFPVLSLKLLSFAEEAGRPRRHMLTQGLLFSAGVVGSFLILALVLIALRGAGESLGWGFQLQSPGFVLALSFLMMALALNLFGVFEFGASVQRAFGSVQTGEGALGAIGSGALAVVLATPCTAPFMGSALAFALTVPTLQGLLVFTMLGFGMAAPYLLLCSVPGATRLLPRPGTWMITFKHAMAFPLLGTVIWLLWVLSIQAGADAVIGALVGLLVLALSLWAYGLWAAPHRPRLLRRAVSLASIVVIGLGAWVAFASMTLSRDAMHTTSSGEFRDTYGQVWQPFSPARVEQLLKAGQTVYIDFTAAWCITCQVNKKLVFSSGDVRSLIARNNIALVRADWTNQDPVITEALAGYGRQGVPLNVILDPTKPTAPLVLPTVLTAGIVEDALQGIGKSR